MAISKILVANRGEIARRVFRTCREMGISSVALYSDPDAGEPHSREADEAVRLPGAKPADTYLNIPAILQAASDSGADALHPGYGFLAENAVFAQAVIEAGLIWIGPPPRAINVMGSKIESKSLMRRAGVPVVPSIELAGLSAPKSAALSLGFPVVVKASAGGGGKGMRVVADSDELNDSIEAARREAVGAFGDGTVFLEKYLASPRHVEIQVFADNHGNVVSLFERECSIQRRHQKIIEESPSPGIDDSLRREMGEAAVAAARTVDYVGAGTVEFLVEDTNFYFLEMNTRLQVEHPVTEMVTGLDLVRLQIEVAEGAPLSPHALRPTTTGHAIEARLYAEDPHNDFLPVSGHIHRFGFEPREGLRIDSGVEDGSNVSVHYDPMLAKIIAYAPSRAEAVASLASALRSAHVHGSTTNRDLLVRVLESRDFVDGNTDTSFLDHHDITALSAPLLDHDEETRAAIAVALADRSLRRAGAVVQKTVPPGWRNSPSQAQRSVYRGPTGEHQIDYITNEGEIHVLGVPPLQIQLASPDLVEIATEDHSYRFEVARYGGIRYADSLSGSARFELLPRFPETAGHEDRGSLHAPMPGKVIRVDVAIGDSVAVGQPLVVLEAMKMEHTLKAPHAGLVTAVACGPDDQVEADEVLVIVVDDQTAPLPRSDIVSA